MLCMPLFSLSLRVDNDSSMSLCMENDSSNLAKKCDGMDADVDCTLRIEAGDLVVDDLFEDIFGEDNGKDVMGVRDTGVVNDSGTVGTDLRALDVVTSFSSRRHSTTPKTVPFFSPIFFSVSPTVPTLRLGSLTLVLMLPALGERKALFVATIAMASSKNLSSADGLTAVVLHSEKLGSVLRTLSAEGLTPWSSSAVGEMENPGLATTVLSFFFVFLVSPVVPKVR